MRYLPRTRVAISILALAVGLLAPAVASDKVRVGDFLTEIATHKGLEFEDARGAEKALRSAGYQIPILDHRGWLTERKVVAISIGLGIKTSTTEPDAELTRGDVDSYFSVFAAELGAPTPNPAAPAEGSSAADPLTKGRGLKKGLRAPKDPL